MRILIETEGSLRSTKIYINGKLQDKLLELEFAISCLREKSGKPALHMVYGDQNHKPIGMTRYFGNDFKKHDELFPDEVGKCVCLKKGEEK